MCPYWSPCHVPVTHSLLASAHFCLHHPLGTKPKRRCYSGHHGRGVRNVPNEDLKSCYHEGHLSPPHLGRAGMVEPGCCLRASASQAVQCHRGFPEPSPPTVRVQPQVCPSPSSDYEANRAAQNLRYQAARKGTQT